MGFRPVGGVRRVFNLLPGTLPHAAPRHRGWLLLQRRPVPDGSVQPAHGLLSTWLSFRTAAIILSGIYLLGVVTLLWAPETKDQPLPRTSR